MDSEGVREMTTKHTPGPLEVRQYGYEKYVVIDGKGGEFANTHSRTNAHLIAAAPDLLEALRDCLGRFIEAFPASAEYEPIKRGFAAIAKAEGRS